MARILVVGGGFAGVWSAASAAHLRQAAGKGPQEVAITLIAPGDDFVVRPRLYEPDPGGYRVPLDRVLAPIRVERVRGLVTAIDVAAGQVIVADEGRPPVRLGYDRLVLAAGSQVRRPLFPGASAVFNVDTLGAAVGLDRHVRDLADRPVNSSRFAAVVVGAGFVGIEVATELVTRLSDIASPAGRQHEVDVVLVDSAPVVGGDLGPTAREMIMEALEELSISCRLGVTVRDVVPGQVQLSDGGRIAAETVVWCAGMQASPLTSALPGRRDALGRLEVDEYLRVSDAPGVFAAGDVAAALTPDGHRVMQSCQHAIPLGKFAGHNAAAELLGFDPQPFAADPYVTCLDLGSAGALFTTGWERAVELTGAAAKGLKRRITGELIYPPFDDGEELMRHANPVRPPAAADFLVG
jgi:NADH dehydrogenase